MTKEIKYDLLTALAVLLVGAAEVAYLGHKSVYERSIEKTVVITVPTKIIEIVITEDKGKTKGELKERIITVSGSGAFITKQGHVLTCAHLFTVGPRKGIDVTTSDGRHSKAMILRLDLNRDLALLATEYRGNPYFEFGSSVGVGETVFAIGNPLGMPFSVTQGIISALHRDDFMVDMTQTDTAINPGNSGGPLINMSGQLIGINSQILPPVDAPIFTGLGFAVSVAQIRAFMEPFRGLEAAR